MSSTEENLLAEIKFLRELVSSLMKQNERLTAPYEGEPNDVPQGIDQELVKDHISAIMGEETSETLDGLDDKGQGGDS